MQKQNKYLFIASILALAAGVAAVCQGPEGGKASVGATSSESAIHSKPTNLKVLPKEISAGDIDKLMQDYNSDLGVPCGYCHDVNSQTKQINYVSDENQIKETARLMIRMTDDINGKYLGQLGDRRYADPITCGNCHQGHVQPPNFEPKSKR